MSSPLSRVIALLLGAAFAAAAWAEAPPEASPAAPPLESSHTDYTVPGARDLPVTCKAGDVQPFAGKTMAEVFGDAWPAQPVPESAAAHAPPRVVAMGKIVPPRGLEGQHAVVVLAILVAADGKMVAAEPICLSAPAYAIAAKRALRGAHFEAGRINGQPVTSVIAAAIVFRPGRSNQGNARSKPGEED
jgi:hypothetical protein